MKFEEKIQHFKFRPKFDFDKNFDFRPEFYFWPKFRLSTNIPFWPKFLLSTKISTFDQNFYFDQNSILYQNFDQNSIFHQKSMFYQNLDFRPNNIDFGWRLDFWQKKQFEFWQKLPSYLKFWLSTKILFLILFSLKYQLLTNIEILSKRSELPHYYGGKNMFIKLLNVHFLAQEKNRF